MFKSICTTISWITGWRLNFEGKAGKAARGKRERGGGGKERKGEKRRRKRNRKSRIKNFRHIDPS